MHIQNKCCIFAADNLLINLPNQTISTMKRFIFSFVFVILSIGVQHAAVVSGTCGGNRLTGEVLEWVYDSTTHVLDITGAGSMNDWTHPGAVPWFEYCYQITVVNLPEGLLEIGAHAFCHTCITTIEIPSTVEVIGYNAFSGCTIDTLVLPASVYDLVSNAFQGCRKLKFVSIENPSINIGYGAFMNCVSLTEVNLPNGLTAIPASCFYTTGLTSINMPDSLKSIGNGAFARCPDLTNFDWPASVATIPENCFSESGLESINLPAGVTTIEARAFENCAELRNILLPSTLTAIDVNAFDNCTNLKTVEVAPENTSYSSYEGVIYTADGSEMVIIPEGKSDTLITHPAYHILPTHRLSNVKFTEIILPGVEEIDSAAIENCPNLVRVHFSEALDTYALGGILHCARLQAIDVPETNTHYTIVDSVLYTKDTTLLVKFPERKIYAEVGDYPGEYTLPIPTAVRRIGEYALSHIFSVRDIYFSLPEGLEQIDGRAFYSSSFNSLTMDAWNGQVPAVTPESFQFYVFGTKQIIVPYSDYKAWAADTVWNTFDIHYRHQDVYSGDLSMSLIHWQYTTATKTLELTGRGPMPAFCDQDYYGWWLLRDSIVTCTIAEGITTIGMYAFVGDTMLTSISFPESLTGIGYYAFDGCKNLVVPTLPDNIARIEDYAFRGCTHTPVWTQELPSALTYIGAANFVGLQGPTAIKFPSNLKYIGDSAFAGCPNVEYIQFRDAPVEHIGNYAFADCPKSSMSAGSGLGLPQTLEYIGDDAFAIYNVGINSASKNFPATLPDSLERIGKAAFLGRNIIWTSTITLPAHLKSIGDSAFVHAKSCNTVRIDTRIAPTIGAHTFPAALEKVYVALGTLNSYTSTEHWSQLNCHIGNFSLRNSGVSASTAEVSIQSENDADKIDHLEAKDYELVMYPGSNSHGYVVGLKPQTEYDLVIYAVSTAGDRERFPLTVTTKALEINSATVQRADSFFRFSSYINTPGLTDGLGFEIQACENYYTPFGDTMRIKATIQDGGPYLLDFYADTILLNYGAKRECKYRVRPFYYDAVGHVTYYPTRSEGWTNIIIDDPYLYVEPIFTADTIAVGAREMTLKVHFDAFGSAPISSLKVNAFNYTTCETQTLDSIPFEGNNEQIFTVSGFNPETEYAVMVFVMSSQVNGYLANRSLYLTTRPAPPVVEYTVTFLNWDDSVLLVLQVPENEMPVYTGETPTRPEDDEYTYVFDGWNPQLSIVTADASYVAKYRSIRKEQAIENLHMEGGKPVKELRDGTLYIKRGGKVYDVAGRKVREAAN